MSQTTVIHVARPSRPPAAPVAVLQIARRVLRKYFRTRGLFVMGIVQSALFLFFFRFVLGGALHAGTTRYVD